MKLISCNVCGVVLDKDKMNFPKDIHDEEGCVDNALAVWDSDRREFVAFKGCPVCEAAILKE